MVDFSGPVVSEHLTRVCHSGEPPPAVAIVDWVARSRSSRPTMASKVDQRSHRARKVEDGLDIAQVISQHRNIERMPGRKVGSFFEQLEKTENRAEGANVNTRPPPSYFAILESRQPQVKWQPRNSPKMPGRVPKGNLN